MGTHRLASIDSVQAAFAAQRYVADRDLATAVYLSLTLDRPLLLEGEAGVGKTEVGRTLAAVLKTELIRLQCYEGLDVNTAVYEWDYPRQMLEIRLLEVRADFAITIPEIGTIKAERPPHVIITSNRTREVHDALKRRCLYHWIDYPTADRELEVLRRRSPALADALAREVVAFVQRLR